MIAFFLNANGLRTTFHFLLGSTSLSALFHFLLFIYCIFTAEITYGLQHPLSPQPDISQR